jgi:hypothetical protein
VRIKYESILILRPKTAPNPRPYVYVSLFHSAQAPLRTPPQTSGRPSILWIPTENRLTYLLFDIPQTRSARELLGTFRSYLSSVSVSDSFRKRDTRARRKRGTTRHAAPHLNSMTMVEGTESCVQLLGVTGFVMPKVYHKSVSITQ